MAATDTALVQQMDDSILDGKYREATDAYCRLVAAQPKDAAQLTTHVMTTAAPYLHVPAHHKLLGIRAGVRLMPWLSEREKYLTLAQAIWYVPQGLDVWAQLECGVPGHYAREQEKCAEDDHRGVLPQPRAPGTRTCCSRPGRTIYRSTRSGRCRPSATICTISTSGTRPDDADPFRCLTRTGSTRSDTRGRPGRHRGRRGEFGDPVRQSAFDLAPLYAPDDLAERDFDDLRDLGFPGEYPFTRGIYPTRYRGRLWTDTRRRGVIVVRETWASFTEDLHRLTLELGLPAFAAVVAVDGVVAALGERHACRN